MWRDALRGGSKDLVGLHTEAAHPPMEAPHLGGMGEEGDQTRVDDLHPEQLVNTKEGSPWRKVQKDRDFQTTAAVPEVWADTALLYLKPPERDLNFLGGRGFDPR